jgi:hypothetical protein
VTWIYFNPGQDWTQDEIIRYPEDWFEKSQEIDLEKATIHLNSSALVLSKRHSKR